MLVVAIQCGLTASSVSQDQIIRRNSRNICLPGAGEAIPSNGEASLRE
jgi:hypothetical protein